MTSCQEVVVPCQMQIKIWSLLQGILLFLQREVNISPKIQKVESIGLNFVFNNQIKVGAQLQKFDRQPKHTQAPLFVIDEI